MPRLGHKKSRNGCRQCKARHVKCDENKPCSNCSRHGVPCSLVTWDPNASQPPAVAAANSSSSAPTTVTKTLSERPRKASSQKAFSATASLGIEYVLNPSPGAASEGSSPHSQNDPFPYLTKFVNNSEISQSNYWVRDLELMHHWSTEAYYTLTSREDLRQLWRIIAPKEAINHIFLMHEILAFSALHLAYRQSEQRKAYYALGIHHQDLAIRSMRKMLQNLSPDNAGPLFATATLITLSVFASTGLEAVNPHPRSSPSHPLEDILDIFFLMQGVGGVLSTAHHWVAASAFHCMTGNAEIDLPSSPVLDDMLAHFPSLMSFFEAQDLDQEVKKEYLDTLGSFRQIIGFAKQPFTDNRELRFLFWWPLCVGPNFLNWIREREPGALVIIMHYSVILHAAGPNYWMMAGWGERLIKTSAKHVDPAWQTATQWPLEYIEAQEQPPQLPPLEGQEKQNVQIPMKEEGSI